MRYAIFADIHANLTALEAVLDHMSKHHVDSYVCVGDIVGYGAEPNECIKVIKNLKASTVLGNHDAACIGAVDLTFFNEYARTAALWTKYVLKPSYYNFFKSQEYVGSEGALFAYVHGTLVDPEKFHYMRDNYQAMSSLSRSKAKLLFVGHTHVPGVFEKKGADLAYNYKKHIELKEKLSYIVNVGSVGQPRNGDPRATYALFDSSSNTVELKCVRYDIGRAQKKILKAGLPASLAYRLAEGV